MDIQIVKKKIDWDAIIVAAMGGWFCGGALILVGPLDPPFLHYMAMPLCAVGFGYLRASHEPVVITVTQGGEEIQPE